MKKINVSKQKTYLFLLNLTKITQHIANVNEHFAK